LAFILPTLLVGALGPILLGFRVPRVERDAMATHQSPQIAKTQQP
jgi:hypothetical protein